MRDDAGRIAALLARVPGDVIEAVEQLHAEIDAAVVGLTRQHATRLQCGRGCHACCVDDLTVFEVEAARIARAHADLLATARPHAEGGCAFLGEAGECRVYDARPQVCRTQGLPLRWLAEDEHEEIVETRSICELNEPGPPIDDLREDACWTLGPVEERLIRLQARVDGEGVRRVALRALFRGGGDEG